MSGLSINTNSTATMAANNLSNTNAQLQNAITENMRPKITSCAVMWPR